MSKIEELWSTAKEDVVLQRINEVIVESIVYCVQCGQKQVNKERCDSCEVCGYKDCD